MTRARLTRWSLTGTFLVAFNCAAIPWNLDRLDQHGPGLYGSFTPQGSFVRPASGGANVNVYVIGSGIDHYNKAQFDDRVADGYNFIGGYPYASDCNGIGTHVAGIVGSKTYGVAQNTTLIPLRISNCRIIPWQTHMVEAIRWVTENHVKPAVVTVSLNINKDPTVNAAVQDSIAAGLTYIVAAGNDNGDACNYSPASAPGAITVAATDLNDARASFSNYGSCVDIFAPGDYMYSAWPITHANQSGYHVGRGTAQAAAHVTGAAALYLSRHPHAGPAEVHNTIMGNADWGIVKNTQGSPNNMIYMGPMTVQMSCDSYGTTARCAVNRVQGAADWYSYQWTWGGNGTLDGNGPAANIASCTNGGYANVAVTDALGYSKSASQYVSCSSGGGGGPFPDTCTNGNCW